MAELRTRFRMVFLYREIINNKCSKDTPFLIKRSGAADGDAFKYYVQFVKEIYDTLPKIRGKIEFPKGASREKREAMKRCIILDGSGVCVVTYVLKKPFKYNKKIYHIFTTRKDGAMIAYQVDIKTGNKKQIKYKLAVKKHKAQVRREKIGSEKHKVAKKKVVKQFQMFGGCYSPDMAYK